ncbi:MAG: Na+/H+ antiporter subunit G [Deltaproteobacteria bacterium]|nr:Na+/H+ antiporter subunit G [Deltaproteobacteria bacterium]
MAEILSLFFLIAGASFTLIAAVGVVRMPDLFIRLHCSTKSATLGVGFIMLGVAIYFGEPAVWAKAMAVVLFLFATAPVAAHIIGRAAYLAGVPLWEHTLGDELKGRYDTETHYLSSTGRDAEANSQPRDRSS